MNNMQKILIKFSIWFIVFLVLLVAFSNLAELANIDSLLIILLPIIVAIPISKIIFNEIFTLNFKNDFSYKKNLNIHNKNLPAPLLGFLFGLHWFVATVLLWYGFILFLDILFVLGVDMNQLVHEKYYIFKSIAVLVSIIFIIKKEVTLRTLAYRKDVAKWIILYFMLLLIITL